MQMLKLADKDFKAAICMTKGRGENVLVKNEKSHQVISNIILYLQTYLLPRGKYYFSPGGPLTPLEIITYTFLSHYG